MHARSRIRASFAAQVTGLPTTGARVYVSRARAIAIDQMPALRITSDAETIESTSVSAPAVLERTLTLTCEAYATGMDDVDAALDTMCAEVEAAIGADPSLGGAAAWCYPSGIEIAIDDEGEQPAGRATLSFAVRYYTTQTEPETAI
jgi:hypothetical protein